MPPTTVPPTCVPPTCVPPTRGTGGAGHDDGGDCQRCAREPGGYAIRVQGHLAPRWGAWFDGMDLTPQDDGSTVISGPVADQSALHGLLRRVGEIGVPLLSVTPLPAVPDTRAQLNRPEHRPL